MNRLSKISGGMLLLVLILAACGGGDTDADTTESDVSNDAPTPTVETINDTNESNTTDTVLDDAAVQMVVPTDVPTEDGGQNASTDDVSGLPINEGGEEILARVNGEAITRTQFELAFERRQASSTAADPNALAITVMDTMIEDLVIRQAAAELGITVTQDEINAEIASNQELVGGDEAWEAWLALNGYTDDEYRNIILPNSLLTPRIIEAVTTIPDTVPQVNARHILVNTEVEAQGILERLQDGEEFGTLAAQYSNDLTTRDQGGDLGWFIPETLTTPELAEVALQLEPGQVAGPVTTQLGYHIIQTLDVSERPPEPEEQALLMEVQFRRWLDTQLEEAIIERYLY